MGLKVNSSIDIATLGLSLTNLHLTFRGNYRVLKKGVNIFEVKSMCFYHYNLDRNPIKSEVVTIEVDTLNQNIMTQLYQKLKIKYPDSVDE